MSTPGTVVTFYSYKGGVGRTFALANTAAVLARWGYRTLCVDWDLDAPGLVYYLRPWLAAPPARGVVDLVEDHAAGRDPDPTDYTVPVAVPDAAGRLDLLAAGAEDDRYVARAQQLDWVALYADRDLGGFLERCRARWTAAYDVVLVDSRTGITDIGGICTAQLPDVLVMLFTANEQSLRGTLDVAERAWKAHDGLPHERGGLQVVPVPSRFDANEEYEEATAWQRRFADELAELVEPWAAQELSTERLIGHLTVPYVSYWSFGERLPAVVEPEPAPGRIAYSLETLAALLAHRLDRTGLLAESRDSFVAAAARGGRRPGASPEVFLSAGTAGRELAERITRGLVGRSVRVFLPGRDVAFRESPAPSVDEALTDAAHLVVLIGGDGLAPHQTREVERFLRQNLDEDAARLVIPVLAPGVRPRSVPGMLAQYRAERLVDDGDDAVAVLVATIVRDVSTAGRPVAEADAVRADALEVLTDLTGWELDALRWALIGQELGEVERAVADNDDVALRAAVTDLELLGPVRGSRFRQLNSIEMPYDLRHRVSGLASRLGGQIDTTAVQKRLLLKALVATYPSYAELELMLAERLGRNLADFDAPGPLRMVVHKLVRAAEAEGWTAELVTGAAAENPHNSELRQLIDSGQLSDLIAVRAAVKDPTGAVQELLPQAGILGDGVAAELGHIVRTASAFQNPLVFAMELLETASRVCWVTVTTASGRSSGTGFLVGPDLVLTNHHVLKNVLDGRTPPTAVRCVFDYHIRADGTPDHGVAAGLAQNWLIAASPIDEQGDPPETRDPGELDYALVRLASKAGLAALPGGRTRGWFDLLASPPEITVGTPLLIVQHPDGHPLKLAIDDNGVLEVDSDQTRFRYGVNTLGGSSGSPCLTFDLALVGLHHGGTRNRVSRSNEGIAIAAIAAHLRAGGHTATLGG